MVLIIMKVEKSHKDGKRLNIMNKSVIKCNRPHLIINDYFLYQNILKILNSINYIIIKNIKCINQNN